MYKTEIGEFKGHKTLTIKDDSDRIVISFGLNKAKAIASCIEEIQKFIDSSKKNTIDLSNLNEVHKEILMQFIKG